MTKGVCSVFNLPDRYKTDVKVALKDFIPKDLKPNDKKRIKYAVKEVRLVYQIAGEEIPSVVDANYRKSGIAKILCAECEQWAKDKGCKEFASDCEITNEESLRFHLHMGYTEENRIICFKKEI